MLYRLLPDPTPLAEADLDTPQMVEAATVVSLGERRLGMLDRMAEAGMELIEIIVETAKSNADLAGSAGDAFCKVSQAVRRTIALHDKLARDVKRERAGLEAERIRRRADASEAYRDAKDEAIMGGVAEALGASFPDGDRGEHEDLVLDVQESLEDPDELAGYLDRPVGETVAKLCAELGLDADVCLFDGAAWKVRRAPSGLVAARSVFRRKVGGKNPPGLHPSP